MKNLLTIDIGFFLLSKKQGYRLRRNWESGWGWGDSKEDRREGSCVRCLRRKVFWTATVGKERRRKWATLKDSIEARAICTKGSGFYDSQGSLVF